jgi:hypothetical protein
MSDRRFTILERMITVCSIIIIYAIYTFFGASAAPATPPVPSQTASDLPVGSSSVKDLGASWVEFTLHERRFLYRRIGNNQAIAPLD